MMKFRILPLIIVSIIFAQTETKVGNLIMQDVPDIPDEIKERTRQYQNVRSASFSSWDPAGSGMLISTRFAETNQLHYIEEPLGARQQITFYDEPVGGGSFCPDPTKRGFIFSKDIGGSEYYQIFWFDLNIGQHTMLTDGESRNGRGPWSNDGSKFAYTSNMANGKDMNVFVGTIDGAEPIQLFDKDGYWVPLNWSADDKKLLVEKYISITESYIWIIDVETKEMTQFNPKDEPISYGSAKFSKDGKGIYYTSDENTEFSHLRYQDLSTGETKILTDHISWNVGAFTLSDNGQYLTYVSNEDGISKLHLILTKNNKELKIPELPMGRIGGLRFHPDNKRLTFTMNTPQTPGDIYVLNLRNKKLTRWTKSEVGGLDTDQFVIPELIHVTSFDGLEVPGFIFKPKGEGPHPVVVYIHGGPESQYNPYFSSTFQYWVNELGLAVLATNVRGSNGYGKSYLKLDNGFKREDSVKDIEYFLNWVDDQPDLDSDRMAVYGGSYGGYMVLACMTHYNDRLRAAVDVVGISNFVTFLKNTKEYRRDLRRAEYGDERDPEMNAHLEKISPNNNARKITKPIFIIQGFNDPRVPVTEAEQMRDVIRENGGDVWYMVAMDEGHGFRKQFNRTYYQNAVSLFWEEFLLK